MSKKTIKSKSNNKTQTEVKKERVALIEGLIIEGLTTTREIHSFIKNHIDKNSKSIYDFGVTYETLMMYIRTAKSNVITRSKPNYLLLSSFLNSELLSIAISARGLDDIVRINAIDKIAKLNGLYDIDLMKRLKYDDILKEDIDKDEEKLNTLSEKEIKERRLARKNANEKRVI